MRTEFKDQPPASERIDSVERTARIKNKALEVGFDKVGIARAEVLAAERERLEEWLRRGFHGEMSWMARDPAQRSDPTQVLREARSVVVVTLNYYTASQHEVSTTSGRGWVPGGERPLTGKISRY